MRMKDIWRTNILSDSIIMKVFNQLKCRASIHHLNFCFLEFIIFSHWENQSKNNFFFLLNLRIGYRLRWNLRLVPRLEMLLTLLGISAVYHAVSGVVYGFLLNDLLINWIDLSFRILIYWWRHFFAHSYVHFQFVEFELVDEEKLIEFLGGEAGTSIKLEETPGS